MVVYVVVIERLLDHFHAKPHQFGNHLSVDARVPALVGIDNQTRIVHAKPHCDSHELYKAILDDRAQGVFNGKIYVAKDAQKTDAKQSNHALLLTRKAQMKSKPELEIYADDVKCSHGTTVGELDSDMIFYLRSRGIEKDAATSLLTYAFASEFVELVEVEALRADLQEFLFSRLPGGEIVRQAV